MPNKDEIVNFTKQMRSGENNVLWENLKHGYAIWHFIRYKRIADFVNVASGKRLLDVGCGVGLLDLMIMNRDIVGIDVSRDNIKEAKRIRETMKLNDNSIHSFPADLYFLPFQRKFDVIICSEVLEHLSRDKLALQSLLSVLIEGGLLLVTIPNILRLKLAQLFSLSLKQHYKYPGHVREYKVTDAYALIESFPLRIEKITGIYFDFPLFQLLNLPFRLPLSLNRPTKFCFFVNKAIYRIYATFWTTLERLFWHHSYYVLIILRKSPLG